jgi:nicotinate phosphoribosyltransferase
MATVDPNPEHPEQRAEQLHAELSRYPAELFQFDPRMCEGWLSDRYFVRTALTLLHAGRDPVVTMQVFAKRSGVLAGVHEAIRLLQTQLRPGFDHRELEIDTLLEGDDINRAGEDEWEPVMHVAGRYAAFAHLETPVLGVLARRSLIATNTRTVVEAARGKPVIFMAPRHDDWRVQTPDGYAAQVGGAQSVSSDAAGSWWGARGVGTMPHAMIAAFGGDTVEATLAFARYLRDQEPGVQLMSLVDYDNNAVETSLAVARAVRAEFGDGVLTGVRVDTSERLVDDSLIGDPAVWGRAKLTGVNPYLVRKMRAALDAEGFGYVGIVVSGGFTPSKIRRFEAEEVPVVAYGIGSSLLGHSDGTGGLLTNFDYTADVVRLDGKPEGKVGRSFRANPRMVRVDWARVEGSA